jgi:hypothetical protein
MELFSKLSTNLHFTSPTEIFLWPNELFQGSPDESRLPQLHDVFLFDFVPSIQ